MSTCNIMTGSGFDLGIMGGFSMAWLAMVLLFFIIVFSRKIMMEGGIPFNDIGAWAGGYLAYILLITFTCSTKWSLLGGIVAFVLGALFAGALFGDSGGF